MKYVRSRAVGFTLVEALVVVAVSVMIFGALFSTFQYSLTVLAHSRAKVTATSLAADRMEYFRSLPYSAVGTVAGIPPGTIPQNSTTTLNNIEFRERILVEYVDDAADGLLTATTTDSNGIPSDYKRIKIEISWSIKNKSQSISLISNIVPRSIETTDGGGTVRVNVLDANAASLAGAFVTLVNNATTPTISVTKATDGSGTALFSGAPAGSGYEVSVTAPGYSTDKTYVATTSNPNPITAPFSVLESDISTVTFQIGSLSDINIATYSSITDTEFTEAFTTLTGIATTTNTEIASGALRLKQNAGVYQSTGVAYLNPFTPSPLLAWGALTVAAADPTNTSHKVHLYIATSSSYALVPDTDLPGNAVGFSGEVIDISRLAVVTYPSLVVGVTLQTSNTSVSPSIDEVSMYYRQAETVRTGVAMSLHGGKVIGTDLSSNPIYKTSLSGTTNGSGRLSFLDKEFDTYVFTLPANLEVVRACPALPLLHQAGIDSALTLELITSVSHSLRASVVSNTGQKIPGAIVTLSRTGFNSAIETNLCGQSFISSGVVPESDYVITVVKPGFDSVTLSTFTINGNNDVIVTLTPS